MNNNESLKFPENIIQHSPVSVVTEDFCMINVKDETITSREKSFAHQLIHVVVAVSLYSNKQLETVIYSVLF